MIVSKKQTLLRCIFTLLTASFVGSVLPAAQAQSLDLRESSSMFSRSGSARDRNLTKQQAAQAQGSIKGQAEEESQSPAAEGEQQPLGAPKDDLDSRIRSSSAIRPSGAEEQLPAPGEDNGLTAARPPENLADQVPADAVPLYSEVSSLEESPETPLILPLPIWEQQRQVQAQQTTSASTPATPPAPQPSSNYVLSASDYVHISVFQENDLTIETRISQDGTINFPLIGVTKIGGKTVNQAVELIRDRLNADYLVNPQVNLTIVQYSRGRFTILGEVTRPGTYDLPQEDSVTLLDAIGSAGGFTRTARTTKVTVKRNVNGKEEIINLDAKKMAREGVQPFIVRPGDTITVPTTFF